VEIQEASPQQGRTNFAVGARVPLIMPQSDREQALRRLISRLDGRLDSLAGPAGTLRCIRIHPNDREEVRRQIELTQEARIEVWEAL
jgi:hypothetical protein